MASIGVGQGDGGAGRPRWPAMRWAGAGLAVLVLSGAAVSVVDGGLLPGASDDPARSIPAALSEEMDGAIGADGGVASAVPTADLAAGGEDARVSQPPDRSLPPSATLATPASVVPGVEPRIVKQAELAIEVDGPVVAAFDRVTDVARSQGGFVVGSSTSSAEKDKGRGELTLRVPADRFDAARTALAEVGDVHSVRLSGDDVTSQLVDLAARLRALRAEEDALNALVAEAGNVGEVLAVRQQVSATRMEIEQVAAQEAALADRATFSTLRVSLFESGAVALPVEPSDGLARSLERALAGAAAVVGGMVVVLGYASPLLALGLLAWSAQRVLRIRRRPV